MSQKDAELTRCWDYYLTHGAEGEIDTVIRSLEDRVLQLETALRRVKESGCPCFAYSDEHSSHCHVAIARTELEKKQ